MLQMPTSKLLQIAAWGVATCLLTGCGIEGSGVITDKEYALDEYRSIELGDGFSGRVVTGDDYSVEIRADDNLMRYVRVREFGSVVTVDIADTTYHGGTLEAVFTLPRLSRVEVTDGGWFEGEDIVCADALSITLEDGSRLSLSLADDSSLDSLKLTATDGSDFEVYAQSETTQLELADGSYGELGGEGEDLDISLTDGSILSARSFEVRTLRFDLEDGSDAEAYADEEATGELSDGSSLDLWGGADVSAKVEDDSVIDKH